MADHQTESPGPADGNYFLMRRLHSLTGLVPLGVFLCLHLSTNATVLMSGDAPGDQFQQSVERIHALGPFLIPIEIVGIFIPLAFHTLLGFQIIFSGRPNAQEYRYGSNIRYTLQRITAIIAFFFILFHLWQMHWLGAPLGGGNFELHDKLGAATAAATAAKPIQSAWWVAPVYAIAIVSIVFHLANGIWTSLITWGITIRPQTQRASGYVCTAMGVGLCLVGLGALRGFQTFDLTDASKPEPHTSARADYREQTHAPNPVLAESLHAEQAISTAHTADVGRK